jgi:tripartite-type tricarboxylate transporter receptor subunit TctC
MAGLALPMLSEIARSQTFPSKPITLVSPYQAGDTVDTIARSIAEVASKDLGHPIVVESKPGAEGLIGALDVAKSTPDGHRILWGGAGSLMVVPALRRTPPFDPVTSFTPVAGSIDFSFFLYVHPSFPAKTAQEFVSYVKANPGKVAYATGNNTSLLTMSDIALRHGLEMERVQYRGETAAVADLLSNRVQAIFATSSLVSYAKEGKLRVLATSLSRRSSLLPDVPSLKESGVDWAEFGGGWLGVYGPPGMQPGVVERLNGAFSAAFAAPELKPKLQMWGLFHTPRTRPGEMAEFTRQQRDLYRSLVRAAKLPVVD